MCSYLIILIVASMPWYECASFYVSTITLQRHVMISCQKAELGVCNRHHVAHEGKNVTLWSFTENIC